MHLAHPSLSMGGKRKGKVKFRNSYMELEAEIIEKEKVWNILKK